MALALEYEKKIWFIGLLHFNDMIGFDWDCGVSFVFSFNLFFSIEKILISNNSNFLIQQNGNQNKKIRRKNINQNVGVL